MTIDEERQLLGNYRGRRLLACRAAEMLDNIVESIGLDDGKELHPRPLPDPPTDAMRCELGNAVALILRMILAANDGGCAPQRLHRF